MFKFVEPLWKLVRGFQSALDTLFWTMLVMAMIVYVFACIGGELIAQNQQLSEDPDTAGILRTNFSSISVIMLTLMQFTTSDMTPIYFPIITTDPWLAIYFGAGFLMITILLMNLVTASLVNDAINQGKADHEMKIKHLKRQVDLFVPELERVFDFLDEDSSGDISMQELSKFNASADAFGYELSDVVKEVLAPENLIDMYECFDADNSGTVNRDEFVQGALAVLTKDTPIEITQLLQLVRNNKRQLDKMCKKLDKLEDEI